MTKWQCNITIKNIGDTIKAYELVKITRNGYGWNGQVEITSIKTGAIEHISRKDVPTHIREHSREDNSYDHGNRVIQVHSSKVKKHGLFGHKSRKEAEIRWFVFKDSPYTNKTMALIAEPIQILSAHYRDTYYLFHETFDHILTMFQTICENHQYVDDKEFEQKIKDAGEIIEEHFLLAVETECKAVSDIKEKFKDALTQQDIILNAFKNNIKTVNEINQNDNKKLNALTTEK